MGFACPFLNAPSFRIGNYTRPVEPIDIRAIIAFLNRNITSDVKYDNDS